MTTQAMEGTQSLHPTFIESGLLPDVVAAAGIYRETDSAKIAKILNWSRPAADLGSCIVIPFLQRDGSKNCFARVRPDNPRTDDKGKKVKYEQPRGAAPRAYFPSAAIKAFNTPRVIIAITEGEKKALAIAQAGVACIGLTGIWAWQKSGEKDKDGAKLERELIDDLAGIDWKDRWVPVIFDTDPRRNPSVNLAAAELTRILETHGAKTIIITLPLGPIGADGLPGKMGADDFIVRHGAKAFRELIKQQAMALIAPARKVEDYQKDLAKARTDSLDQPGFVNLDASPTGAGKSHAATTAKQHAGTSLTILATHKNCAEEEENFISLGMNAAAYPKLDGETCRRYPEAEKAITHGLSASGALCQTCEHKTSCEYWVGMNAAAAAEHSLATHARAAMSLEEIGKGKKFVDIHEDPVGLLRPSVSISTSFDAVAKLANYAKGDCLKSTYKQPEAWFYQLMEDACDWINEQFDVATESSRIELPDCTTAPATVDAALLWAMKQMSIWPAGEAVRIAKGLAAGDISEICIRVDPVFTRGGEQAIKKSVIAFWQSKLPTKAVVWVSDATASPAEIQPLCNLPVIDRTPGGRIEQRFPIIQIPVDLKKSTSAGVFIRTLANVIRRTNAKRIGIICDQCHTAAVKGTAKKGPVLPADLRERIARVEHFRGGEGRGSNSWLGQCDLMIIAGTPRVPPAAVRTRLLRAGKVEAAARPDTVTAWGPDYWSGRTKAGKLRTVTTLAYRDRDWRQAFQSTVQAELLQCIGRGRAIRETGMPVLVITCDDLRTPENPAGFPLANSENYFLNDAEEKILIAMKKIVDSLSDQLSKGEPGRQQTDELSGQPSKEESSSGNAPLSGQNPIYILETRPFSSSWIAKEAKTDSRFAIRVLNLLAKKSLVEKVGLRGGWKLKLEGWRLAGGVA
jgi:hypothetical protein